MLVIFVIVAAFQVDCGQVIYARHDKLIHDYDLCKLGDDIVASSNGNKGMPLGVEPSQAEMIAFPSPLDNYIKCQLSIKCAGHYMDDYYIIVPPKEIMRLIVQKASELDLTISKEKSRIVPLSKPFRYCKAKYTLTESGRVIVTGNRGSFKRTRHKIKAFYEKVQNGEMSYEDLWTSCVFRGLPKSSTSVEVAAALLCYLWLFSRKHRKFQSDGEIKRCSTLYIEDLDILLFAIV